MLRIGDELTLLRVGTVLNGGRGVPVEMVAVAIVYVDDGGAEITAVGKDRAGERVVFHGDRIGEEWSSPDWPTTRFVRHAEPIGRGNSLPLLRAARRHYLITIGEDG
ncbi:MAG: hypothetical protein A2855_02315 [Candidatus Liptonbacteria bacterium RIFCSPHIGHO2_01_FULL_57_28]|uniref:Uncharacterized protein n=1 Tax=Candidatus Liptonbacteria bacterium RIFCSPHIGHO2_01_FULL_57_28 TaxID=1798647 RepID=A0A1G2C9N4_9BACT|nr:MAG: hypothetical protein A2855_02315 [Candidatus Liptonbacteria bacterium RIFCSPHIGHO2_01_FULL_57_28]